MERKQMRFVRAEFLEITTPLAALRTDGTSRLGGTQASSPNRKIGEIVQLSHGGPCRIPFQKGGVEK